MPDVLICQRPFLRNLPTERSPQADPPERERLPRGARRRRVSRPARPPRPPRCRRSAPEM